MREIKKISIVMCLLLAALMLKWNKINVQAATPFVTNCAVDVKQKVRKTTFIAKQYRVGTDYRYKIVMKKNGKNKVIAKNTTCAFATDGKTLYYVACGKKVDDYRYQNTIYKYNIKTGKKSKVVSGTDYTILGCSGTYLYCGTDLYAGGVDLYAVHVKTKKKVYMRDCAGSVDYIDNRIVVSTNTGAPGNYPIYSFKLNGTGKKKIADGGMIKTKGKLIYYFVIDEKNWKFKIYTCSATGKNKKAITGWIERIPDEYYK
ncbi:MAG: hypothetical protein Q4D51_05875 [Eubacteriales bacterium]|nr:hypothetical protein [Eubacteriales bacterium]